MRHKIKSLSIALLMALAMFAVTACGSKKADSGVDPTVAENLELTEAGLLTTLGELGDEDIDGYLESGDSFTVSAMNTWKDNKEELGAFQEIKESEVVMKGDLYVVTSKAAFEKADATVTMNVEAATGTPTYMNIEVKYGLGQLMGRAALNTVMGICIVFVMLLVLSGIIGLFVFVNRGAKRAKKAQPQAAPAVQAQTPAPAAPETEELADDGALVAVIAAAIAAGENTSTDSFVVRSIRRKTNNKWQRA